MANGTAPAARRLPAALVALALAVLAVVVFWPAVHFGFVAYDDNLYVVENPVVQAGLTWRGLAWALRSLSADNWHPVTWLAHMADVEMFGLDAGGHHLVNVLLHAVNTALLFGWLAAATGARARSALVAALFAVHPLHVESVAWVAERKDLLSTLWWLLAMTAYLRYVRRPSAGRYLLVVAAFALGLMSKPMVVTLPVVLLLLDVWPLGRLRLEGRWSLREVWRLAAEKLPLLALAAASSVVTVVAQAERALASTDRLPMWERVANAAISYARYLRHAVWPEGLAVLYPHPAFQPGGIPAGDLLVAIASLGAIGALAVWQRRTRSFIAVGLGWYLVTLLPVIGLVQVGIQGLADRYTYVPMIGVFLAVAWALPAPEGRAGRVALTGGAAVALAACVVAARTQLAHWRDTAALFERAVSVTRGSWQAMEILGAEYLRQGRPAEAEPLFRAALELRPGDPVMWKNLAAVLARRGDHAGASESLERAVRIAPLDLDAWVALATEYAWLERPDRVRHLVERLGRIDPGKARELAGRLRADAAGEGGR